jgi:hypothetical protein
MSSAACKQGLLSPTRWFAIICAIASGVNLHEELANLLVAKDMVTAALHSTSRSLPAYHSLASKLSATFFS